MADRRKPDPSLMIIWDDTEGGNIDHLAEHGVTPDEFEQVLAGHFRDRQVSPSNPRNWQCHGFTDAGRFLKIVFEYFEDEHAINPVTAYEPSRKDL